MQMKLSEALDEFLQYRRASVGIKESTLKNDAMNLRSFIRSTGDIQVSKVRSDHVARHLASKSESGPGNHNNHVAKLNLFFEFCRRRAYVRKDFDPMRETHRRKTVQRDSNRVPVTDFPLLLDRAGSPRNRAVIAAALYLLCRANEIRTLNVGDLDLATGRIRVTVHKSGGLVDNMPVSTEFDREMRTWLTYYTNDIGHVPSPDMPLFPAQRYIHEEHNASGRFHPGDGVYHLDPYYRCGKLERVAHTALNNIGFPIRDADGKSLNEGMHTFRRSGARALFDQLCEQSYDGAIRMVQSMLHHKNMNTTEIYLGLNMEQHKRDELLRGHSMYGTVDLGSNVVNLRQVSNG